VRPVDFVYARQMGCTVRQISYAESTGNALITSVGPALVPLTSTFARTVDNQNAVQLTGENSGTTVLGGVGAGGAATAVAVVSDLLTLCNSMPQVPGPAVLRRYSQAELATRHYIRFSGKSNGQLMARARRRLADHGIAVEQRLDTPAEYKGHNALVVGRCTSRALHRAFSEPKQVRENAFSMPLLM
jgi:homoserine dehydrogenase